MINTCSNDNEMALAVWLKFWIDVLDRVCSELSCAVDNALLSFWYFTLWEMAWYVYIRWQKQGFNLFTLIKFLYWLLYTGGSTMLQTFLLPSCVYLAFILHFTVCYLIRVQWLKQKTMCSFWVSKTHIFVIS